VIIGSSWRKDMTGGGSFAARVPLYPSATIVVEKQAENPGLISLTLRHLYWGMIIT